jgi:hypothetical protein
MNRGHVEDFARLRLTIPEYFKRYYDGHFNPAGNHLFAHAIKDTIVDWLEPKPIPYRNHRRDHTSGR